MSFFDKLSHYSDRGVQYVSIQYIEHLANAGIEASVGSVSNSYDNPLAETIYCVYKAEVIYCKFWKYGGDVVEFKTVA
jgi:transposase InsO family protein